MEGWKKQKLRPLCDLITKGTTPTSLGLKFESAGVNFVKVESITNNGKFLPENFAYVSDVVNKVLKRSMLQKGDILFSIAGALGKVAVVDERILPANINQALAIIRFAQNAETLPQYVFYFLNSQDIAEQIRAANVQLAQANLSLRNVSDFEISYPSLEEQTKIATVLSSIDKAIEQTEKLIEKQQRIKHSLLHDLLTKGIDENGAIRSEATHEFKDSPLGRIPKEWEPFSLDEIIESITSGSRGWAKYYSHEGDIFLRIGNLNRENISLCLDNVIRVKPPQGNEGIRTALKKDDVLISITADLGIIGIVPEGLGTAYINQHIALVRLNQKKVIPRWVAHYLSSLSGQRQFEKLNESGAKAGLNLPAVASLLVAIPRRVQEQAAISHLLDGNISMIDKEKAKRIKLEAIKKGLMQDLLTGKVRVNSEQTIES